MTKCITCGDIATYHGSMGTSYCENCAKLYLTYSQVVDGFVDREEVPHPDALHDDIISDIEVFTYPRGCKYTVLDLHQIHYSHLDKFMKIHNLSKPTTCSILGITERQLDKFESGKEVIPNSIKILVYIFIENPELFLQIYRVEKL